MSSDHRLAKIGNAAQRSAERKLQRDIYHSNPWDGAVVLYRQCLLEACATMVGHGLQ